MAPSRKRAPSLHSVLVLQALATGIRYGFEVMAATDLPSGTVYPILRRFEGAGFVTSDWEEPDRAAEDSRPARRYYRLTPTGHAELSESLARLREQQHLLANLATKRAGGRS